MSEKPVVIVTGASRGLGAAVARWLAKSGAAVTLVARSEDKLQQSNRSNRDRHFMMLLNSVGLVQDHTGRKEKRSEPVVE